MPTITTQTSIIQSTTSATRQKRVATTSTGENYDFRGVTVGTSEYEFTIDTSVATSGWCHVANQDDTNYVQLGFATGVYYIRLAAGDTMLIPLEPTVSSLFLKADTAACVVDVFVTEA